ncbi:MAG: ABC transporter permease subunit [Candidatus Helarchaeota archaeon]
MKKTMRDQLYKFQKYGSLTYIFIFISIGLFILIFIPIIQMLFSENILTLFETVQTDYVITAIMWSFLCSFLSTILAMFFGIPLAYLLAKFEFPGKEIIDSLIDLPLLIPHSVAGIMLLFAYGQNGILGQIFGIFGIIFFNTPWGITIAMFFVSSPILIKGMRDAFLKIDPNYEKAARTLGASRARAFFDIDISLSAHDILSNSILCWARGISEFGAVYVLASFPLTGATLVYFQYEGSGIAASRPIAIVLILITIIIFIILRIIEKKAKQREGII